MSESIAAGAEGPETRELLQLRPYARLLTMLGEQLIKNDRIALVELIKNSYDADATRVTLDFCHFASDFTSRADSRIVLMDNGDGMSEAVVLEHWLNPATPGKLDRKRDNPETRRGRRLQGEKGIGRFAIFKIGSRAVMTTRADGSETELVLEYDLRFLGSSQPVDATETRPEYSLESPKYIDEVPVTIIRRTPRVFTGLDERTNPAHGTRIEIASLRSGWSDRDVRKAYGEVARLQPIVFSGVGKIAPTAEFVVEFCRDGERLPYKDDSASQLQLLFQERAVLRVQGKYLAANQMLELNVNGVETRLGLADPALTGLRVYRRLFADKNEPRDVNTIECGPFDFSMYVFDFAMNAAPEHSLDPTDKALIRAHRIYLYRDGVRVLPYGDPDDDWLQVDVIRGTWGARQALSNDQTVGFVHITHEGNPLLQDKTNREGLIESGRAFGDLVMLLQIVVAHLRAKPFAQYTVHKNESREYAHDRATSIASTLLALKPLVSSSASGRAAVSELEKSYAADHDYWTMRTERTEDLAGVGLSVEAASHDILAAATRALSKAKALAQDFQQIFPGNLRFDHELASVVDHLAFVVSRLSDVQGLFVSTRQRRRRLDAAVYSKRVQSMFGTMIANAKTRVDVEALGPPLSILSTEAALLQVLINLFDNALYWQAAASVAEPRIRIVIDGNSRELVFADNGPGVRAADAPYIFEPFYSGKGEEGKGLGLYIARQLGLRMGFRVELLSDPNLMVLGGANFVVAFDEGGDKRDERA